MPSNYGSMYGMSILQQGAEAIAKSREEQQKAEAQVLGNRPLYEKAVKAGLIDLDQQTEYLRGNAKTRDSILAGAMRSYEMQRQQEADQQRKQAFALDQKRFDMEQARAKWTPPPEAVAAAEKSRQQIIQTGPASFTMAPLPRPTPTKEQMDQIQSEATKVGGSVIPMPDGTFRFERKPAPSTPPTPTVDVPGVGRLPATHPAAEARIKELDPSTQIHQQYGAKPSDFMPENVELGGANEAFKIPWDPKAEIKTKVRLKNTGTIMDMGEYSKWLNQLADTGAISGPVKHPLTGQTITPAQPQQQQAARNPKELSYDDPNSIAIVQGFLDQYGGDPTLAKQAAAKAGYTWP